MRPVRHYCVMRLLGSDGFVFRGFRFARTWFTNRLGFNDGGILIIGGTDRRRKDSEVQARFNLLDFTVTVAFIAVKPFVAILAVAPVAVVAIISVTAIVALRAAIFAFLAFISVFDRNIGFGIFFIAGFEVALIFAPLTAFAIVVPPLVALRTILFLSAAVIGENTEIMICKLVVIFGLHPVTVQLGVLR